MQRHGAQAGKIDWRWWALQSHFLLSHSTSCPVSPVPQSSLPKMPRIYLAGWTDAIFMTLLLFYHGNSFESIYQSAAAIRHVALKDQVQVIPSLHSGALRWKGGRKKIYPPPARYPITATGHMRMLLKQLSKHALTSLTPHPKPPPSRCL